MNGCYCWCLNRSVCVDATCHRKGQWWICMLTVENLYISFYAIHSTARAWNIATFPSLQCLHLHIYFTYFSIYTTYIYRMLSHEIWNKKQNPSSSNESSSRQMFGLPRLELKSFLCSPVHPSQYLRGAIKSSEDSFSFLILHGSNSDSLRQLPES